MAFLATDKGSINERYIVRLEVQQNVDPHIVKVFYTGGSEILATYADIDDTKAFMDKVNAR